MGAIIDFKSKGKIEPEADQERAPIMAPVDRTLAALQALEGMTPRDHADMVIMNRMGTYENVQRWLHAAALRMVYSWREAFLVDIKDCQETMKWNRCDDPGESRDRHERFITEEIALVERAAVIYDEVFEQIDGRAKAGREQVAARLEAEFANDPKARRLGDFLRVDNPFEWLQGIEGEND